MTIRILTILLSLVSLATSGQNASDGCGLDRDPKLNKCELEFFNTLFGDEVFKKKNYDFHGKAFAFISGGQLVSKDDFFKLVVDYKGPKGFDFFNCEQRARTGFAGIISINSKAYNLDNIAKMIEKQKDKWRLRNRLVPAKTCEILAVCNAIL